MRYLEGIIFWKQVENLYEVVKGRATQFGTLDARRCAGVQSERGGTEDKWNGSLCSGRVP